MAIIDHRIGRITCTHGQIGEDNMYGDDWRMCLLMGEIRHLLVCHLVMSRIICEHRAMTVMNANPRLHWLWLTCRAEGGTANLLIIFVVMTRAE